MSRRSILSATERTGLLALPESQDDLIRYYTFNEIDVALIRQRRGGANISRNYAPISVYHRLACLTSAFWYVV